MSFLTVCTSHVSQSWYANVVPSDLSWIVRVSLVSMKRSVRQFLMSFWIAMIFALLNNFVLRAVTYFGGIVQTWTGLLLCSAS